MIEKALMIIMFMYATGFGLIGAQYVLGDVFGITLRNYQGIEIKSNILEVMNVTAINEASLNIVNTNETVAITDPFVGAASIAWELFLLLTGTYVFNVLFLLGVPSIIIGGMVLLYVMLLARAIIAYLRGI